ncbi:MAG TPA: hypothetical protein VEL07_08535 [Planctomycetota bacterium]|nr:hypothetical protein [Planctomycetota bacterium]
MRGPLLATLLLAGCARQVGDVSADEALASIRASATYQQLHRRGADAGHATRLLLDDLSDGWWRITVAADRDDHVARLESWRVERRTGRIEREVDGAWVGVAD